ncbi:MAG: P1 family peptidase [Christensenellales bacterium]|jgi:L-aminopeptidase/D-esterase-like protein
MFKGDICDIRGITVGHASNFSGKTGVSVVICEKGAVCGCKVRGAAPGTRETDLARPENSVEKMHAVCLSGGSAFGLDAAGGVMRFLAEKGVGFDVGVGVVPIVGGAVLFDLTVGDPKAFPTGDMGYEAAKNASSSFQQGQIGAGAGATCGKLLPGAKSHRGGIGSSCVRLPSGAMVAALIAVNAAGDIYQPETGGLIAAGYVDGEMTPSLPILLGEGVAESFPGQNTTIGVIATNAKLDKAGANRLASVAHDGLALAIRPVHTMMDGDTLFALATCEVEENPLILQAAAVKATWQAVINAVTV